MPADGFPGTRQPATGPFCAWGTPQWGIQNHPAPDGGLGLECDKLSRAAMDFHFKQFFGKVLPAMRPLEFLEKRWIRVSMGTKYEMARLARALQGS